VVFLVAVLLLVVAVLLLLTVLLLVEAVACLTWEPFLVVAVLLLVVAVLLLVEAVLLLALLLIAEAEALRVGLKNPAVVALQDQGHGSDLEETRTMNGNNRQRMSAFVDFPEYDLGPTVQRQVLPTEQPRGLVPVGQLMGGVGMPEPAMQPQPVMQPQPYDQGQPEGKVKGKTIMGMPKDQFIALMGSIAQAFGGDSASGRMGANLINMAGMMRGERLEKDKARAAEAKAGRKAKAQTAKEKRAAAAKKKGKAPTVRTFRVGDMDVQHAYDYDIGEWKPIPGMKGKKVKDVEGKEKPPTIRTFRVGDRDVQHAWESATGGWKPIPGMPGKKVTPPAGEKLPTHAEKRARAKELRSAEISILNPENLENPAVQANIDFFNETTDKPYVYQRTPGTPAKETGYFDLERDVEAVPSTIEKVNVSTPEKVRDSDLPIETKLNLLRSRFGYE
jgi:hypothetical protein